MSLTRMTILAPEGMLGYGIPPRSMAEGMKRNPDALAAFCGLLALATSASAECARVLTALSRTRTTTPSRLQRSTAMGRVV